MVTFDEYNGVCVITLVGDFSGEDTKTARQLVIDIIEKKQIANFAIDMEKCPFVDSEGLETLLWIKKRSDDLFGVFKLIKPDDHVSKILQITRLDHRFDIGNDLTIAMKAMR